MSIDNDPGRGRPRTSIDERSVKLVANALKEDRRATCEEHSRATGANTSQENHKNRPQLLMAGPLILQDNAHQHIAEVAIKNLRNYGWEMLPHASDSSDMSPPDFDLFPKLKKTYAWTTFFLSGRASYRRCPGYSTRE